MKKINFWSITLLFFLVTNAYSQPGYTAYIKNFTKPSARTIRFEVWLESNGASTLRLEGIQCGLNIDNYSSLANNGQVTGSFVNGSADNRLSDLQQSPHWRVNTSSHQVQLFSAPAFPDSIAPIVPAASSGGFKLGIFELTNTVDFPSGVMPDLSWSYATGTSSSTKTAVFFYIDGAHKGTNLTNPSSHIIIK